MSSGTVLWFDQTKGYGFISPADPEGADSKGKSKDLFFHAKSIDDDRVPQQNDSVDFFVGKDRKGKDCALKVCDGAVTNIHRFTILQCVLFFFLLLLLWKASWWWCKNPARIQSPCSKS